MDVILDMVDEVEICGVYSTKLAEETLESNHKLPKSKRLNLK